MEKIDFTGQKIGKLTVLDIDPEHSHNDNGRLLWRCQCECGNIVYKTVDSLKVKNKKHPMACSVRCGALLPNGTKINRLTIIKPIFENGQETKYECQCDCGNTVIISSQHLKRGTTKSCGCLQKEHMSEIGKKYSIKTDITNERFGKLIALKPTEKRPSEKTRSIIWECICDCGEYHYASVHNLKNGSVSRCPKCFTISKGEDKICEILDNNNINYSRQQTFSGCRFKDTGKLARFDFYIDNKYIIEFDGEQHFTYSDSPKTWNTEQNYNRTVSHDKYKNEWCKKNNIPLIRIPYWSYNNLSLEDLLLETTKFLINN